MMNSTVEITLLVENTTRKRGLLAEHGLAYWIESPNHNLLFDTGQGMALRHNARACGKRLVKVNTIVLSHGHYDHVGGLEAVLDEAPQATVCLHPDAFRRRYSGQSGDTRPVDERFLTEGGLERKSVKTVLTTEPTRVVDSLWVTGEVPRLTSYEDTGGEFYLDAEGCVEDPILDDQAIYFRSDKGVVVILGCAHAGVVNTIRQVGKLMGTDRIHAVIGGMHLLHAGPERLEKTHAAFRDMDVQLIAPCHCTGMHAVASFWNAFPGQCVEAHAGVTFRFNLPHPGEK